MVFNTNYNNNNSNGSSGRLVPPFFRAPQINLNHLSPTYLGRFDATLDVLLKVDRDFVIRGLQQLGARHFEDGARICRESELASEDGRRRLRRGHLEARSDVEL